MNDLVLISDFIFSTLRSLVTTINTSFILLIPVAYFLLDNLVYLLNKVKGKR